MSTHYLWWTKVHIIKAADLKSILHKLIYWELKRFFQYKFGPTPKVRLHSGFLGCGDSKDVFLHILSGVFVDQKSCPLTPKEAWFLSIA